MNAGESDPPGLNLGETDTAAHAKAAHDVFGFWVFLMSDAVLFALLLATYGVMLPATAGGPGPADEYRIGPALLETVILLTSSFTFGMASVAMKHDRGMRGLIAWLAASLALGLAFLVLEWHDFATMLGSGAGPDRSGYLSAFFALVPLHGLHVLAGCIWILVMIAQLATFGRDAHVKINLLRLGLFWHFLDIIWIAIFTTVYLPGLAR